MGEQENIEVFVGKDPDKKIVEAFRLTVKYCLWQCTTASAVEPECQVQSCKEPGRIERHLRP